jgi:hypothetical protein
MKLKDFDNKLQNVLNYVMIEQDEPLLDFIKTLKRLRKHESLPKEGLHLVDCDTDECWEMLIKYCDGDKASKENAQAFVWLAQHITGHVYPEAVQLYFFTKRQQNGH